MSDGKALKHFMGRCNNLEREAILLKNENIKLQCMLDHALQMIVQIRDENRQLSAIVAGDPLQVEINRIIADVGCC
jgi:hypothetical protein